MVLQGVGVSQAASSVPAQVMLPLSTGVGCLLDVPDQDVSGKLCLLSLSCSDHFLSQCDCVCSL